jgi:hypothetical protein
MLSGERIPILHQQVSSDESFVLLALELTLGDRVEPGFGAMPHDCDEI